jgi:MFS family permease
MQVAQLGVATILTLLTLTGQITPLHLYVASAGLALMTALEMPARQAIVPNLVPRELLTSAFALNNTIRYVGMIAGPSLAGVILALGGSAWCYLADGLSRLGFAVAMLVIQLGTGAEVGRGRVSLQSLRGGFDFVWTHPVILCCTLLDFGATLFATPRSLFPVFARDILDVGPQGLGMLFAAPGIGAVIGGLFMSRRGLLKHPGHWILLGVTFYALCTIGFALSASFPLALLFLAGTGLGNTVSAVLRQTINQIGTPNDLRGRVASVNSIFTTGGPQLGQFQSGLIAEVWSAPISALFGGLATLAVVAAVAAPPIVRRFDQSTVLEPKPQEART